MINLMIKIIGSTATLISFDTMVWDRWKWLARRMPRTNNGEQVLDVGCGSGAFSICLAKRAYSPLGLSWDERNQEQARIRAEMCKPKTAVFEVQDVRTLDGRADLLNRFDTVICCENIEHILDDLRLFRAMYGCLKPGGRLLLTTPNAEYVPLNNDDCGPFREVEDGGHVRRGYTPSMLRELCAESGFFVEEISYCTGYASQKTTGFFRFLNRFGVAVAWIIILPFRVLARLADHSISKLLNWPGYSICLLATKPRFK
jgi:2-polyprenyl-3-methyl-5-hydroxy-6-metoxy-1,4-benzoquinol methylase